jgi:K+-transporting ATPase A subunit
MNKNLFYAKNKEELKMKIEELLKNKSESAPKMMYEVFSKWLDWFNINYSNIKLKSLKESQDLFYKAYGTTEDFFSIQVWKKYDENLVCTTTLPFLTNFIFLILRQIKQRFSPNLLK